MVPGVAVVYTGGDSIYFQRGGERCRQLPFLTAFPHPLAAPAEIGKGLPMTRAAPPLKDNCPQAARAQTPGQLVARNGGMLLFSG